MLVSMILPWQESLWCRLTGQLASLPHALLLAGPGGQCVGCRLREAENHPDLLRVVPEAEGAADEDEGGEAAKGKSTQIRIDQVRELQPALTVTAHRGGRRVVIVDPAEAMNVFTANALLKLLEEPPAGVVFLLVSAQPQRLLPTLRSRCQRWDFPLPDAATVLPWLRAHHPGTPPELLALVGGAPLAAAALGEKGGQGLRQRLVADLAALGDGPGGRSPGGPGALLPRPGGYAASPGGQAQQGGCRRLLQ